MKKTRIIWTAMPVLVLSLCAGCARFHTKQIDTYDTSITSTNQAAGTPGIQTRTTEVSCYTLFSAKSALTSFAARQADASQSATVGSLTQQGATNAGSTIQALANLLKEVNALKQ